METATKAKRRILLVDDAAENLRILGENLRHNYTIMFARNGQDALRIANGDPQPDIILLDVVMPGMDGYQVCRQLKDTARTKHIPVIFVTAQNEEDDEAMALALGVEDYIKKPFQISVVRNRVDNHLKLKDLRDALRRKNLELKEERDSLDEQVKERTKELAAYTVELQNTQVATIHAMANLAEWRDPETGAHIKRTQNYMGALARALAKNPAFADMLPEEEIERLQVSAPLHDVGKVAIPDAILQKPGKLTDEEFAEMKTHTTQGHRLLKTAEEELGGHSFLHTADEIAHSHHERWDGRGYPQGLKGEEIPLSARIMSVADVYDALRSKRVYKPAMPHEKAASIILEGRGTQFDPDVVDVFMSIQDEIQDIAARYSDADKPEDARKVGLTG